MSWEALAGMDKVSHRDTLLNRLDARLKIALVVAAIVYLVAAGGLVAGLAMAALCVLTLLLSGVRPLTLLWRYLPVVVVAGLVLFSQVLVTGSTPLFRLDLASLQLTGYQEGLAVGLAMAGRILGGVSVVFFLNYTTPVHALLEGLCWYRAPRILVELIALTYRYIFLLVEEGQRVKEAQKLRLAYGGTGPRSWLRSLAAATTLMGAVLVRAWDRAENVHYAMELRGTTMRKGTGY